MAEGGVLYCCVSSVKAPQFRGVQDVKGAGGDKNGIPDTRKPARGGLLVLIYRHPELYVNRYLPLTAAFA